MARSSSPIPEDPRIALDHLLILESAQARKPVAEYLANEVEVRLHQWMILGVIGKNSPEYVAARMLAGRLRRTGKVEYMDCELADLPSKVTGFLSCSGPADAS